MKVINQSVLSDRIIYEDNHLIAVNKLPSWLVQGDKTGDESLIDAIKKYIKVKYGKPGEVFLGSIHRLDRPVSGLVIFARTSKALERMNALFSGRDIIKTYFAITEGMPPQSAGTLEHYLLKDGKTNTVKAFSQGMRIPAGAKPARLDYVLANRVDNVSLLRINPLTGRSHQIRVQLASMRCPILGDIKYGAKKALQDQSIALHSFSLEFIHPVLKSQIRIEASFPESQWWQML